MAPKTETHLSVPDAAEHGSWRRITPGCALMALAALMAAGVAARDSAVFAMTSRYPELATKLAPGNATAIGNAFERAIASGTLQQNLSGWIPAAKQALRADPLNAKGLRLLAYVTEMSDGGRPKARAIMQLSERASRRDLLAQFWLIEDAVQRGDTVGALQHYDRVLSVRSGAEGQLIPVLVAASSEPEIQAALVPYLRANRSWVPAFLATAVANAPDPVAVARLFQLYGGARTVPAHAELETRLIQRLVQSGKIREAHAFAVHAGGAPNAFAFSAATIDPRYRPLAWTLYEGADGSVALENQDSLAISVRADMTIVAASRTIPAGPGLQVLGQRLSAPADSLFPLVTWKAYCRLPAGPERFWTRDIPVTATPTWIEAPINIPAGCAGVQIDVEATGSAGSEVSRVTIGQVRLVAR